MMVSCNFFPHRFNLLRKLNTVLLQKGSRIDGVCLTAGTKWCRLFIQHCVDFESQLIERGCIFHTKPLGEASRRSVNQRELELFELQKNTEVVQTKGTGFGWSMILLSVWVYFVKWDTFVWSVCACVGVLNDFKIFVPIIFLFVSFVLQLLSIACDCGEQHASKWWSDSKVCPWGRRVKLRCMCVGGWQGCCCLLDNETKSQTYLHNDSSLMLMELKEKAAVT